MYTNHKASLVRAEEYARTLERLADKRLVREEDNTPHAVRAVDGNGARYFDANTKKWFYVKKAS